MNADAVAALRRGVETLPSLLNGGLLPNTNPFEYERSLVSRAAVLELIDDYIVIEEVAAHRREAALAATPLPSEPCPGCEICVGEIDDCGCVIGHEHTCAPLPSDTPADGLDVERLTRALWVVEFEAEEGPYEHASEANVIDVTDLAEAIAREYAALALTQEPRSGADR